MAVYIYSGEDLYRLEEALHLLIQKHHIDADHTVRIDASNKRSFKVESVLMECDTFSIFDEDEKAVIVQDPFFLSSSQKEEKKKSSENAKKKSDKEQDDRLNKLESYLKHSNPNTLLIFYCHGFNADSRKKEHKLLTKYGAECVTCKKMNADEFHQYLLKKIKESSFSLDADALKELEDRVDLDTLLLHQALIKMDLYGEKHFNVNDIRPLVSLNSEVDIFALTSAFSKGDLKACMETVNEMLNANYDYTVMISMLSKRLRTIFNMRYLYEQGYTNDDIAARMHVKSGYVYYVLKDSRNMTSKQILSILNELADMDQGIKQGRYIARDVFEQFLIRNGQKQYAYRSSF